MSNDMPTTDNDGRPVITDEHNIIVLARRDPEDPGNYKITSFVDHEYADTAMTVLISTAVRMSEGPNTCHHVREVGEQLRMLGFVLEMHADVHSDRPAPDTVERTGTHHLDGTECSDPNCATPDHVMVVVTGSEDPRLNG